MANEAEVVSVSEDVSVTLPGTTPAVGGLEVTSLRGEVGFAFPGTSLTGGVEVVALAIEYATIIPAGLLEVVSVAVEISVTLPLKSSGRVQGEFIKKGGFIQGDPGFDIVPP